MAINKKKLSKRIRLLLASILALLFAASAYGVFYVYRKPAETEKSVPAYSYQHKGELNYQVRLKPNIIFQESVLGPGKSYYTKIVDRMDVFLSYQFKGDKEASPLKGAYEVVAVMEDPEVWQKEYVLVPFTEVFAEGKSLSFRKDFQVNPSFYNDFLKKINEEVGVGTKEPKLTVKAKIFVRADTPEGTARDNLTPTMTIPLSTGSFKVGGDLTAQKEGALTKKQMVTDPVLKKLKERLVYLLFIPITPGIFMVLLVIFTESRPVVIDRRKRLVDSVNKKYGERMVRVQEDIIPSGEKPAITMNSMEELVKVADELGKPIFFNDSIDPGALPTYYVFDGLMAFRHTLDFREDAQKNMKLPGPGFLTQQGPRQLEGKGY